MEKIIINKNFINGLRIHSLNDNSTIFVKDNDLIKMPKIPKGYEHSNLGRNMIASMSETIEYISELNINPFILPKYSLYTSKALPINYKGYGMDYLKDYKDLEESFELTKYSYEDRMKICKTLCDAIIGLEKYKVTYWDLHSNNVLLKGNDIKLCDVDSSVVCKISGHREYKSTLMWSYKHLSLLLLSILYDIDEFELSDMIKSNSKAKFINDSKMFKRALEDDYYMFYPDKYLDAFTEDYIEDTKLLLKR